jgi:hypothetical protein
MYPLNVATSPAALVAVNATGLVALPTVWGSDTV